MWCFLHVEKHHSDNTKQKTHLLNTAQIAPKPQKKDKDSPVSR